jgi:hypothetical protein
MRVWKQGCRGIEVKGDRNRVFNKTIFDIDQRNWAMQKKPSDYNRLKQGGVFNGLIILGM